VVPANDPLSDKIRPSSAAVFIKHQPDVDLRLLVPAVKDMVSHSIEGLSHDQVSLTLVPAREGALAHRAPRAADDGFPWPALPSATKAIVLALGCAALAALVVLPTLLRRNGLSFSTWWRQVRRG